MRFDGLVLTSISAFDYFSSHSLDNYDGYPAADNNWTKNFQQQQFSEELRLASANPAASSTGSWAPSTRKNWFRCRDSLDWTFVYGLADYITQGGKAITGDELHPDTVIGRALRPCGNPSLEPLDPRDGRSLLAR